MIPLPIRRAVLILAVVAFLVVRASAQSSDAAFVSSLDQSAPIFAQLKRAKKTPQKPVAPPPAAITADDSVWRKVLETVKADGKYTPGNAPMSGAFTVEESMGDPKGDRTTQAISVLGRINDEEQFEALGAMIVVIESKLDPKDGNYHGEHWMFQTDIYGEVGEIDHNTIIRSPDGKIVRETRATADPADPKTKAQYEAMLKHWAERTPKGAGK